jgi:hypothetical protein
VPAIADKVRAATASNLDQFARLFAAGVAAGEWPRHTDPALAARLFTAGLYGLMGQWHNDPGSFSLETAMRALAGPDDHDPGTAHAPGPKGTTEGASP